MSEPYERASDASEPNQLGDYLPERVSDAGYSPDSSREVDFALRSEVSRHAETGQLSNLHLYETRGELRDEMERLRQECSIADAFVKNIRPADAWPEAEPSASGQQLPSREIASQPCADIIQSASIERQRELLKSWDDVMERLFPLLHQLLTLSESPSAQHEASICEQLLRENRTRMATPKALLQIMGSLTEALSLWQHDTRDRTSMLEASLVQLQEHSKLGMERAYDSLTRKNERLERMQLLETENAELRDQLYIFQKKLSLQHTLQKFGGVPRVSSPKKTMPFYERPSRRKCEDARPLYSLPTSGKTRTTKQAVRGPRFERASISDRFDADSIYVKH